MPEWWITGASPAAGNLDCEAWMKGVRCTVYALGLGLSGLQFFFERGADEVTFGAGDPIVCV